ncbi:TIR domain-containing protein [Rhodobacter viridis]|uniref:TIR domain-containing protein n=1 Tax=Rhodobacter viridis TaxID=1054202 RepID=A0A318TVH4_9RHOB|nr:toll/interleukin-1 receptor domain-containing protein [Rhodobacter viridis]PYF08664.1 TIR domain-containing protein [Rhodobacter viridis]
MTGVPAYRLVIEGETSRFDAALRRALSDALEPFGLKLDDEVALDFASQSLAAAMPGDAKVVLFFGSHAVRATAKPMVSATDLLIPIVSDLSACSSELPPEVAAFNALQYGGNSDTQAEALASAVLETLGLMPAKRRIFLSYRRTEARDAALQVHDALLARQFSVFLDTHEIRYGGRFQDALWHQLSDCDVLLMLDTTGYFTSRWTEEEFGRAGNMRLGILRVGFPGVAPAPAATLTTTVALSDVDLDSDGRLCGTAIDRIGDALERFRARSVAARLDNMLGTLRLAVEKRGGTISNPGPLKRVSISLPRLTLGENAELTVYPAVGVPTSDAVERIAKHADAECALLYDGQSLLQSWIDHLEWFAGGIERFRWIRADNPDPMLKELQR